MRIGILETDTLSHDLIESYGTYADMFKKLLLSVNAELQFNVYQSIEGEYPENINDCDAYLITGSKASVYDDDAWIKQLQAYILQLHEHRKKLIGICFGHQLIGQAFGATVTKSDKGWGVGNISSNVVHHLNWTKSGRDDFTLLYSHQDQVDALPAGATLLASHDFCPISSLQIDSHILTFQGHPEFTPEYAKSRLEARRSKIGESVYQTAVRSLPNPNDSLQVAKWMVDFIR